MKKKILFALVIVFTFMCLNATYSSENKVVNIIHLNDIHAQIDRFSNLKHLVDSLEQTGETVLVFGAGDFFSGNPIVDFYDPKGLPIIELMNKTGFDLVCLGNHDFDYGQKSLQFLRLRSQFPFICSNIAIKDTNSSINPIQSTYTFYLNGLTINVIGAIQVSSNGFPSTSPDKLSGLSFSEPINSIKLAIKTLDKKANATIALTHIGFANDSLLALSCPELNLIIGGHSHTLINPLKTINGVHIAQTNGNMKNVGIVKLFFRNDTLSDIKGTMLELSKIKADSALKSRIDFYNDDPVLNKTLAKTAYPITKPFEIGLLIGDALRSKYKCDFAYMNYGGMRIDKIDTGAIRVKDVLSLLPFGNTVNILNIDIAELKSILKKSWDSEEQSPAIISGGKVELKIKDKKIEEIIIKNKDGKILNDTKKITLAINDYAYKVYVNKNLAKTTEHPEKVSDVLLEYLKKQKKLNYKDKKSVFIIEK